MQTKCYDKDSV